MPLLRVDRLAELADGRDAVAVEVVGAIQLTQLPLAERQVRGACPILELGKTAFSREVVQLSPGVVPFRDGFHQAAMEDEVLPALTEAVADMGYTRPTPIQAEAIPVGLAGGLLAFALSIDDYVVTSFTSGATQTFPLYIYGAQLRGIPVQVNVIGTMIFVSAVALVILTTVWQRRVAARDRPTFAVADWRGTMRLARAAYTQLTPGGALPPPGSVLDDEALARPPPPPGAAPWGARRAPPVRRSCRRGTRATTGS